MNDIDAFIAQYGILNHLKTDVFHDRFVLIDNRCYHVGASFNRLGNRVFAVIEMEDEGVICGIRGKIESLLDKIKTQV